jgi:glycerophosphoryl diester phosphodiesterase
MPILIGHRGASALAPENTLEGIKKAFLCGASFAEVDVRLSRDSHLVLMHDETVDRTTNGSGLVEKLSIEELQGLDAGGERVPSLVEAINLASEHCGGLVIDMKEEGLEALVLEALSGKNIRTIVTSFYHQSLWELKQLQLDMIREPDAMVCSSNEEAPMPGRNCDRRRYDIKTGIIVSSLPIDPVGMAERARADAIFPERINANLFKSAHEKGISVYPRTINDPAKAEWLLRLGADGLVTDDPCSQKPMTESPLKDTTKENCSYYPCHHFEGQACTHCFCPLYPCRDPELGKFVRTKRGKRVWSCIDCDLVHREKAAKFLQAHPGASTSDLKDILRQG